MSSSDEDKKKNKIDSIPHKKRLSMKKTIQKNTMDRYISRRLLRTGNQYTLDRYFFKKIEKRCKRAVNKGTKKIAVKTEDEEKENKEKFYSSNRGQRISLKATFPVRKTPEVIDLISDDEEPSKSCNGKTDFAIESERSADVNDRVEMECDENNPDCAPDEEESPVVKVNINTHPRVSLAELPASFFYSNRKQTSDYSVPTTSFNELHGKKVEKNEGPAKTHDSGIQDEVTISLINSNESDSTCQESLFDVNDSVTLSILQPSINETSALNENLETSYGMSDNMFNESFYPELNQSSDRPLPMGTWTSGNVFENTLCELMYEDFQKNYSKLGCDLVPACTAAEACNDSHKLAVKTVVTSGRHPNLFCSLVVNFKIWSSDLVNTALSLLLPDQYFSGDVLRILFDYLLYGPNKEQAKNVHYLLMCHFKTHLTCSNVIKCLYTELLGSPIIGDCYFDTSLANEGLLRYVIEALENHVFSESGEENLVSPNPVAAAQLTGAGPSTSSAAEPNPAQVFQEMEDRWSNFEPLFGKEEERLMKFVEELADDSSVPKTRILPKSDRRERLITALALLVDLLMGDFMTCVANLKVWIKEEVFGSENCWSDPIIRHFITEDFQDKIFYMYASTSDSRIWLQINRLIGMMAELLHLFEPDRPKIWLYPNLNKDTTEFSTRFFDAIKCSMWSFPNKLQRMQNLKPPWLRQQITMMFVNAELKIQMGNNLNSIVNILNMYVRTPEQAEYIAKSRSRITETVKPRITDGKSSVLPKSTTKNFDQRNEKANKHKILKANSANSDGDTPLHLAVKASDIERSSLLVQYKGLSAIAKRNKMGETPISLAKKNSREIFEWFKGKMALQEYWNQRAHAGELNLNPDIILMMDIASAAIMQDHHTLNLVEKLLVKKEANFEKPRFIDLDLKCLLVYKKNVRQFSKLTEILEKVVTCNMSNEIAEQWLIKLKI